MRKFNLRHSATEIHEIRNARCKRTGRYFYWKFVRANPSKSRIANPSHFPHCGKITVSCVISGPAPSRFCLWRQPSEQEIVQMALSPTAKNHAESRSWTWLAINNSRRKRHGSAIGPDIISFETHQKSVALYGAPARSQQAVVKMRSQ